MKQSLSTDFRKINKFHENLSMRNRIVPWDRLTVAIRNSVNARKIENGC